MSQNYKQNPSISSSETRFTNAPTSELEFSRMIAHPQHLTTFNAGDIIPIRCFEVLPNDTYDVSLDFVIRQTTVETPTMGQLFVDYYAYFVPNRIVNDSWVNVMGENTSGKWTAPSVALAPLSTQACKVPVGSVADHYGYPTQGTIPASLMQQMHENKIRGYLSIYNSYFRDENWMPPIPFSTLNICNHFFDNNSAYTPFEVSVPEGTVADGSEGAGSVQKAIGGAGSVQPHTADGESTVYLNSSTFKATGAPLKACKYHDMFTSCLPSPQKGSEVIISASGELPVTTGVVNSDIDITFPSLKFISSYPITPGSARPLYIDSYSSVRSDSAGQKDATTGMGFVIPSNLYAQLGEVELLSVNELRMSSAIQRVYELLARGGSRYREFINNFFGLDTDNPFMDIPTQLGHFRRKLDLYQTAQTSASIDGETPQGNLTAFGYTATGGHLFRKTFLEHGYVHILAVVRHPNIYSSTLSKDNFRLTQLDYYMHPLANISEQPIYTYEINPFADNPHGVWGYNEAWVQYREEPNTVSGKMRTGIGADSLSMWNYADEYDQTLTTVDGAWLQSNSASVVDRTLAITSEHEPQFKGQFVFTIDKQRAMPIYSVPGMDII